MRNEHATEEDRDRHETWLGSEMTERLKIAIADKKQVWLKQLAMASTAGDINHIRALGGRIQGLQDAEQLIDGGVIQ